jgi:hypothetical protein
MGFIASQVVEPTIVYNIFGGGVAGTGSVWRLLFDRLLTEEAFLKK